VRDYREPWLTKAAAAEFWGCSERTIEYAMKDGMPYATIFGRPKFRPTECEPWLEANGLLVRVGGCTVVADPANGAATADTAPPHDREVSPDGKEA
jgi:hypothetical protein